MNALALIVEDDDQIADVIDRYFTREGFRTTRVSNGMAALDVHAALKPDVILLDIMMPRMDGWAVLSEIRRRGSTPVIMMTALDQDIEKLQALRMGADDYVVKPFNPLELVARATAVLRRGRALGEDRVLRVGSLEIDPAGHMASIHSSEGRVTLDLTLTEHRMLEFMARQPMRVFTRGDLIDACLPGDEVLERTVDSHVSKLRRKLGSAGAGDLITSIRGLGYRFNRR